jgi:glutamine synthetase
MDRIASGRGGIARFAPCLRFAASPAAGVCARFLARGIVPVAGAELEFFLSADVSLEDISEALLPLSESFPLLFPALEREKYPGQYELIFPHGADLAALCAAVEEAKAHLAAFCAGRGLSCGFRGVEGGGVPQGMHFHIHQADAQGRNLFAPRADGAMTDAMAAALAGLLALLPASVKYLVPSPESYARFSLRSPLSPSSVCWGKDNRSAALRVPEDAPACRRVECRVPTPDADPVSALSCILLSMEYGLARGLSCPPPLFGNGFDAQYGLTKLPRSREEALALRDEAIDGPMEARPEEGTA